MLVARNFLKYYSSCIPFLPLFLRDPYANLIAKFYTKILEKCNGAELSDLEFMGYERAFSLLKYANRNVPRYGSDLCNGKVFNLAQFKKFWQSLPVYPRRDYKENIDSFLSRDSYFRSHRLSYFTSGSTGMPMTYYYEHYRYEIHHAAALMYVFRNFSVDTKNRYLLTTFASRFTGKFLPMSIDHYYLFPNYDDLTPSSGFIEKFVNHIETLQPPFPILRMRPLQALIVARWLLDKRKKIDIPFLILVGENLNEEHRALIEKAFNCDARMVYSTRELGIIGYECSKNLGYIHLFIETHLVELRNDETGTMASEGEMAPIAITSFVNLTMPFIRYKNGDYAVIKSTSPCSCGSSRPLIRVLGRESDLVNIGTVVIPYINIEGALFGEGRARKIRQMQCVQTAPRSFTLRLVVDNIFSSKDELGMTVAFKKVCGPGIKVSFKDVKFIEPTVSGKFVNFKSFIKPPSGGLT